MEPVRDSRYFSHQVNNSKLVIKKNTFFCLLYILTISTYISLLIMFVAVEFIRDWRYYRNNGGGIITVFQEALSPRFSPLDTLETKHKASSSGDCLGFSATLAKWLIIMMWCHLWGTNNIINMPEVVWIDTIRFHVLETWKQ